MRPLRRLGVVHGHLSRAEATPSPASAGIDGLEAWQAQARERALSLPNRGPLELVDGRLAPAIVRTLEETGFYVFTGVINEAELADIRADVARVLERPSSRAVSPDEAAGTEYRDKAQQVRRQHATPIGGGEEIDARLAAAPDEWFSMAPPLSDPDGGHGRSPSKMVEGEVPADAPELVMRGASRFFEYSEAGIRLYGHPGLLAAAASILGEDFMPDGGGESIQIKLPGLGPSVAWHQGTCTRAALCPAFSAV